MTAHRILEDLLLADYEIGDPGNLGTIRVDRRCAVVNVTTTGEGQSRVLDAPTKEGQVVNIVHAVDGGDFYLTVTGGYDADGSTIANFYAAGDYLLLMSVKSGTTYRWDSVKWSGVLGPVNSVGQYYDGNGILNPGLRAKMWANCPSPADPRYHSLVHEYFNDFVKLAADYDVTNEWTYSEQGAGGAAAIVADSVGGNLTLTTDALDNDACQIVLQQMQFKLAAGKKLWYETKFQLTTANKHIQSDWAVGMINSEDLKGVADNLPANGIVFHKDDGDANIDITAPDNGDNTSTSDNIGTFASGASADFVLGFHVNGGASGAAIVTPYINGVAKTPMTISYATAPTLAPVFMIRNGEAGAVVMTVDYVKVVQMR